MARARVTKGKLQRGARTAKEAQTSQAAIGAKPADTAVITVTAGGSEGVVGALYVAQPGDTAAQIATRFGTAADLLQSVNPQLWQDSRVFPGMVLLIPLTPPVLPVVSRIATEYVVQPGDSLFTIARRFNVSLNALQRVNPFLQPDRLFAGQVLLIPLLAEPPVTKAAAQLYVVQPDDTPRTVAARFGISLAALQAANPQRADSNRLYTGEVIAIPAPGTAGAPVLDTVRCIVQPGDTLADLAARFQVWEPAIGRLNAIAAAVPGLLLQLPATVPVPAPPPVPAGFAPGRPAPFGQRLFLADDDSVYIAFPDSFRFSFYGVPQPGVWVNANGNLTFGAADPQFYPTTDGFLEGLPRVAPFWTDLFPPAAVGSGGVFADLYYDFAAGEPRCAITWDRVPILGWELFCTVQVLLSQDGSIQFGYFAVPPLPGADEAPRILIGVAPGGNKRGADIFLYTGRENFRRAGDAGMPLPQGTLAGRTVRYSYDREAGRYGMTFS